MPSKEVKRDARAAGFSERTLARARTSLGVKVASEGFPRESFWSLPDDTTTKVATGGASPASGATDPVGARRGGTTGLGGTTGPELPVSGSDGSTHPQSCQSCQDDVRGATDGPTGNADPLPLLGRTA